MVESSGDKLVVKALRRRSRRIARSMAVLAVVLPFAGCVFSERSIPMQPGDLIRVAPWPASSPRTMRRWLNDTHSQLEHLLPRSRARALVTKDLVDSAGRPIDVLGHFGLKHRNLRRVLENWSGLSHSAQAIGSEFFIDRAPPAWPGFEDIWIPVSDGIQLSGRLGFSENHGRIRDADCIVLLPGLFGDKGILRTRDLAAALRASGLHVLALDLRGHGQTEARYPDVYYTFGVLETVDLMIVSEWLESLPHVRRTGLIGFCWGANLGLLAAWYDSRPPQHVSITSALARRLPPVSPKPHFSAGVIAFSTVFHFEGLIEELETPTAFVIDPVLANMQATTRQRSKRKNHPEITHSLGKLIEFEYARSDLSYPQGTEDGLRFLRLTPFKGKPAGDKLANARMPILVVQAANDPLCPAQVVADLIAELDNPNVAALILPGGGHIGFAPYARSYYFNLIVSFFHPQHGAAGSS